MDDKPLTLAFAFLLGLMHSLEPSHAKAVLASYFLNKKRTVVEALFFALTVTLAHTFTIFVIALIGFAIGPIINSETLERWGQLFGGIFMVGLAIWMFFNERKAQFHGKDACCGGHDESGGHFFHHHHFGHQHPLPRSFREIFLVGFCSGAIPCVLGLVVLAQAWSTGSPMKGLLLVGIFSLGLGSVVLVMALMMQQLGRLAAKLENYWNHSVNLTRWLPLLSAFLIFSMGCYSIISWKKGGTHDHRHEMPAGSKEDNHSHGIHEGEHSHEH
jgi:nickel/cobalt transporter (NicO) family protein